ncbi:MAG: corrinoid protein [Smithellaceae bacterium]|nr:corrinoid protein [Smithellaceae bacterium]
MAADSEGEGAMAIENIYRGILEFEAEQVIGGVRAELARGTEVSTILNRGLIRAMDEVGRRFGEGDFFLPEMLQAAKAMKAGLEILRPLLTQGEEKRMGTVIIATVKGDLHDIGKNLVAMMLEGAGFMVVDLGVDVDESGFLRAVEENRADMVCMSALLTTTMPAMEKTVRALKERDHRIRTMVGGAPVTRHFADQIGADGYAADAAEAVGEARRLLV